MSRSPSSLEEIWVSHGVHRTVFLGSWLPSPVVPWLLYNLPEREVEKKSQTQTYDGTSRRIRWNVSECVFRVRLAVEETMVRIDQFLSSCLQPMSDQDSTSHDNINAISSRKVMRIKRNINAKFFEPTLRKTVWQTVRIIANEISLKSERVVWNTYLISASKRREKKVRSSRARVKVSVLNTTDVIAVNQSL